MSLVAVTSSFSPDAVTALTAMGADYARESIAYDSGGRATVSSAHHNIAVTGGLEQSHGPNRTSSVKMLNRTYFRLRSRYTSIARILPNRRF